MHALRTPFRRIPHRAVALLLIAALPHSAAAVQDPFAGVHSLKDEQLDQLRGGFENNQGLQFSFAIERAVVINGELVTSTRLVLNDLSPLLSGGVPSAEITNSVRSIVQNGFGNTVSPAPTGQPRTTTTAAAPPTPAPIAAQSGVSNTSTPTVGMPPVVSIPATVSTPAAAAATVSAPAAATVSASAPSTPAVSSPPSTSAPPALAAPASNAPAPAAIAAVTSPSAPPSAPTGAASPQTQAPNDTAPLFIQRNAGGQTIVIPNASAIVTAVQNSVNNQIIQTRTTIDAMLNSLSALRANTLANAIRQQSLDSVRRQ